MKYSQDDSVFVMKLTPKILTLANASDVFTGGAHGSASISYKNVNPATGVVYTLDDFLKPGSKAELTKIGEKHFRSEFLPSIDMKPTDALSEENGFWFDSNKKDEGVDNIFYLCDNFAITDKGISFVYGLYEVVPYAMGMPEFTIPFSEIKSLLKDEWAAELIK